MNLVVEIGDGYGLVVVLDGYEDMVVLGDVDKWYMDLLVVIIKDNWLYGCGVMDMKVGLMVEVFVMIVLYD